MAHSVQYTMNTHKTQLCRRLHVRDTSMHCSADQHATWFKLKASLLSNSTFAVLSLKNSTTVLVFQL